MGTLRTLPTGTKQGLRAYLTKQRTEIDQAIASLLPFTRFTMPRYRPSWHHKLLADELDRLRRGEIRRLLVCMPPRHGKSQLCTRHFPAHCLGHNPDEEIISASYAASLARAMNRDVQRIIDSERYRVLFPDVRLNGSNVRSVAGSALRNADEFEIVGRDGKYRAVGVGGGITGKGGSLLIIDDPFKNREEADSPTIRESVWEWYTSTLRTRAAPGARILVVNTRWNRDDLTGKLLALSETDPEADQWTVLTLPAIAESPQHPDPRKPGEALWPERFPLDELNKIRRNSSYEWAALYQQNPTAEGGTEWDDSYFPASMWFEEWPKDCLIRVLTLDPSKGKNDKHGDYSAIVELAVDNNLDLYIDADLARRPIDRLVREFLDHLIAFKPKAYAVETNQFQEVLAVEIEKQTKERGVMIPLVMMENMTSKVARIRSGVGPWLARNRLFFKRHSAGARLVVDQFREFPNGGHDDGPDAVEMAIRLACELIAGDGQGEQFVGTLQ